MYSVFLRLGRSQKKLFSANGNESEVVDDDEIYTHSGPGPEMSEVEMPMKSTHIFGILNIKLLQKCRN